MKRKKIIGMKIIIFIIPMILPIMTEKNMV